MKNLKKKYSEEHLHKSSMVHTYPTEWVIRTLLGTYPDLKKGNQIREGAKVLDMGFGDCRNMPLLNNIGLDISGVEITEEIVNLGKEKLNSMGISADLKVGKNSSLPYNDEMFDVILACASMYYVDENTSFKDTLREYLRVLKKGGLLIANFPEYSKNYICKDCIDLEDSHIKITNDVHGLRNGFVFKVFKSRDQIVTELSEFFTDISIGYVYEDYYGYPLSLYLVSAQKK